MKKIYLVVLVFIAFNLSTNSFAQRKAGGKITSFPGIQVKNKISQRTGAAGCDTLNFAESASWNYTLYGVGAANGGGVISGTNGYNDQQKAEYFDQSATTNTYLTKVWIAFAYASTKTPSLEVPVHIYSADGTGGTPGTLLATTSTKMSDIIANVADTNYTEVTFSPAVTLPVSKKFFVSVDMSNLNYPVDKDSLFIFSNTEGDEEAGGAWEQFDGGDWYAFTDVKSWGANISLVIHPFVSTNTTCSLLPVNLISFNAQKKNKDVELNWLVAQEKDMDYYEVERAVDMLKFVSVGKVPANNSPLVHSYSFVDRNAASTGKLFYRLRKVDKDGSYLYSNILNFNTRQVSSIKVAAFTGNNIPVFINSVSTQKVSATLYDLQGRVIAKNKEQMLVVGSNNINVQVNTAPRNGIYILSLFIDGVKHNYKIFKQ